MNAKLALKFLETSVFLCFPCIFSSYSFYKSPNSVVYSVSIQLDNFLSNGGANLFLFIDPLLLHHVTLLRWAF